MVPPDSFCLLHAVDLFKPDTCRDDPGFHLRYQLTGNAQQGHDGIILDLDAVQHSRRVSGARGGLFFATTQTATGLGIYEASYTQHLHRPACVREEDLRIAAVIQCIRGYLGNVYALNHSTVLLQELDGLVNCQHCCVRQGSPTPHNVIFTAPQRPEDTSC
jgi:hypothetical protein